MKNILEIQQLPPVTYLPNLPAWIPGVCNLRGNIVSIVDIKQLLGFEVTALGPRTRLVVVRTDNQDLTAGLIVDEIVRIAEMEPAQSAGRPDRWKVRSAITSREPTKPMAR